MRKYLSRLGAICAIAAFGIAGTVPVVASGHATAHPALSRVAEYQIDPGLDHHLQNLFERKESLDSQQYDELMALVAFTQQRTIDKLEAQTALNRLRELFPELADRN